MLPHSTARAVDPTASTIPKPVICDPGSMPRMRTPRLTDPPLEPRASIPRAPSRGLLQELLGDIRIAVHVLHVVELVEHVEQLQERLGLLAFDAHLRRGPHRDLGALGLEPGR